MPCVGFFVLSGKAVALNYTPIVVFPIIAARGSYTWLIADLVTIDASQTLSVASGGYAVSGKVASLIYTPVAANAIAAERGTYNWKIADLVTIESSLSVAAGSYALGGKAAGLTYPGYPFACLQANDFALTGAFGFLDRRARGQHGNYSLGPGRRAHPQRLHDQCSHRRVFPCDRGPRQDRFGAQCRKGTYAVVGPDRSQLSQVFTLCAAGVYSLSSKAVALRRLPLSPVRRCLRSWAARHSSVSGRLPPERDLYRCRQDDRLSRQVRPSNKPAALFLMAKRSRSRAEGDQRSGRRILASGKVVAFVNARILVAAKGTYALSGKDAGLVYQTLNARVIDAQRGSYALTGQAVTLRAPYQLTAARGVYAFTGRPTALNRLRTIALNSGAYGITGRPVGLTYGQHFFTIVVGSHAYTLSGKTVDFVAPVHEIALVQMEASEHFGIFTAEEVTKGKPMSFENSGTDFQEAADETFVRDSTVRLKFNFFNAEGAEVDPATATVTISYVTLGGGESTHVTYALTQTDAGWTYDWDSSVASPCVIAVHAQTEDGQPVSSIDGEFRLKANRANREVSGDW